MIIGIGTDIVEIARMAAAIERNPQRFPERVLTASELVEYHTAKNKPRFLAKRFAAKEACSKAFGTGIGKDIAFTDIEISHEESGKPIITIVNGSFSNRPLKIHLSISDEVSNAIAYVVIEER